MKELKKILKEEFKVQPSLSEFVSFIEKTTYYSGENNIGYRLYAILRYNYFLEYFAPSKDGVVLIDPETTMMQGDGQVYYGSDEIEFEEYQKAEDEVIYKNMLYWKANKLVTDTNKDPVWTLWGKSKTIADMGGRPITLNFWNFLK